MVEGYNVVVSESRFLHRFFGDDDPGDEVGEQPDASEEEGDSPQYADDHRVEAQEAAEPSAHAAEDAVIFRTV